MRTALNLLTVIAISLIFAGCNQVTSQQHLTVDFDKDETIRYRFVSSREVEVLWPGRKTDRSNSKMNKSTEKLTMVVAYTPVETDPYGLSKIEATIESAKVQRRQPRARKPVRPDAVESLAGQSYVFSIAPDGRIEDYSKLQALIRKAGEKAFHTSSRAGRVKDPDMIGDFITTQWFFWDSISSVEEALEGVSVGQSWKSKLPVPNPLLLKLAREVTYTLEEIRDTKEGKMAVISSSYSQAGSVPQDWPKPYPSGRFQMVGTFGFLGSLGRNFKVAELTGQGQQLFNLEPGKGKIEQANQQYQTKIEVDLPLAGQVRPQILIRHNISVQLIGM